MSKKTYTVVTCVEHDNVRFEIGSSIDLNDAPAEALYAVGAISAPTGDAAPDVPTDPAERLAAITAAIGKLDPNNADIWLKDGRPDMTAIAENTGWPLSSAERNAAWTAIKG